MGARAAIGVCITATLLWVGCADRPVAPNTPGRVLLEVSYEAGQAKLTRAMVLERVVVRVSKDGVEAFQRDLQRQGGRWQGEIEIEPGRYQVDLEGYQLGRLRWRGITSVIVTAGKAVTASVVMQPTNRPVASAGVDQRVRVGDVVRRDGSGTYDDQLSYQWTAPTEISLSDDQTVSPTFAATALGTYRITLVVNDGQVDSAPDEVIVTVQPNQAPVANAGLDQRVTVGDVVRLDGSASDDADGDQLSYQWTAPRGISLRGGSQTASPILSATNGGTYRITLVVNDGQVDSAPDEVVIKVLAQSNQAPVANAGLPILSISATATAERKAWGISNDRTTVTMEIANSGAGNATDVIVTGRARGSRGAAVSDASRFLGIVAAGSDRLFDLVFDRTSRFSVDSRYVYTVDFTVSYAEGADFTGSVRVY